jgi:hypothetical protein
MPEGVPGILVTNHWMLRLGEARLECVIETSTAVFPSPSSLLEHHPILNSTHALNLNTYQIAIF